MFDGQIQPQAVPAIQARLRLLQLLRSPGALSGHRLKMEVSTICKAYVRAKFKGISPQNMAKNMVQYLDFRLLKIPLKLGLISLIFIFFPSDDSSTRL